MAELRDNNFVLELLKGFSIDKVDITDPEAIGDVWPATRSIHIGLSLGI